jgi:enamine deaminase RidA (YjgF/YER057c/UK114 family)
LCHPNQARQFLHSRPEGGLDESDVARLYIDYYAPNDWQQVAAASATIAAVQREFYPEPGPCSTAVRVSGFAVENLLIEIEALAACRNCTLRGLE